jgi:hypothetical protein
LHLKAGVRLGLQQPDVPVSVHARLRLSALRVDGSQTVALAGDEDYALEPCDALLRLQRQEALGLPGGQAWDALDHGDRDGWVRASRARESVLDHVRKTVEIDRAVCTR